MKKCSRCQMVKDFSNFHRNKSRKDGLCLSCRECQSKYARQHYLLNTQKYKDKSKKSNTKARKQINEYIKDLKSKPCSDCKQIYPYYVMDFDHLPEYQKHKNIAEMKCTSLRTVKEEIAKCELVCANCHRSRTWKRKNEALLRDRTAMSSVQKKHNAII